MNRFGISTLLHMFAFEYLSKYEIVDRIKVKKGMLNIVHFVKKKVNVSRNTKLAYVALRHYTQF